MGLGSMNRRRFLQEAALACAVGGEGVKWLNAADRPGKQFHVVIVGAGLAGLCAAYELERRGHAVTLLEAEAGMW